MRALLMHDIVPDDAAAAVLEAAGHEVVRCGPPDTHGLACDGIGGHCPLDATVDVAVVVHDRPTTELALGEAGVICALRDGVPLVLAGHAGPSPFAERASAVAWTIDQIPGACEAAVGVAGRRAGATITEAIGTDASVQRNGNAVVVTLPADATEKAAVLAHQAAHRMFPAARTIDVLREASA
jgi:hypothetical protein